MYYWIQGFLLVVIISLGAAERRWCQPSRYDVTITSDGWVEYDDITFACVTCGNASQTRLINRRRLSNYECCSGQLVARGNCDVIPSLPGGTCSSGEKCDGVKQCVDGSDELNCRECNGTNKFSCNDSHDTDPCVGTNQVCDGRKDCEMGLDETGCNWYGGQCDGFLCGGAHPRCIPLSQVCDGTKQCMDGSDEHNCRYCLMQFRCSVFLRADPKDPGVNTTTAECIGSFRVCDGQQDCLNGLDESNCYRWKEWTTWGECGSPVACQRTRTRDCLNKAGNIVEAHHCHHVEDYHHKDGSPGGQNQTEICQECITTTTTTTISTTLATTTTEIEPTTVLAPTTVNSTTTETHLSTTDITAYEGSSSDNDNVSVTTYTTQAVNQNTSQSNIMTSSYEKSTTFDAVTKSDLNTSNGSTYVVTDASIPTHQPRASGLGLPLVIALISIAVLFVIILIVACIFCCTERRRKTGKWIPRRRYHEREPVRVSQMYYDVSLDGVEETINRIDSNPNLKPCALDTFSAVTAPSAVDSGIDENHSTTSTRRSNHSPSLSITSSQSSQSEGFPAPPSPLTNQNTSV